MITNYPIQPRTTLTVLKTAITNTNSITLAHGALSSGGHYDTFTNFDPVITRVITENSELQDTELPYSLASWRPTLWDQINTVRTPEGVRQRLVVIPAQFRATNSKIGTARRFSNMNYTIYYSNTKDTIPPSIWEVQTELKAEKQSLQIQVEVTDFSDVARTVATYTTGDGIWQTVDLVQNKDDPNLWVGQLPYQQGLAYFVQAVDKGGNVAVYDNKGRYISLPTLYLPLITNRP